jgi:hypothetical protein
MRDSKSYQSWRTVVIQVLFGYDVMKQMYYKVGIDEWSKTLSSAMLIPAQNQICHGNALE